MNVSNVNTSDLGFVVGKFFLRVVKNNGFYFELRKQLFKLKSNGFELCDDKKKINNINDFFSIINNHAEREFLRLNRPNKNVYDKVTININLMLHYTLENCGINPHKLGSFGQEIFDLSCYHLFGDKFLEDMEELENSIPIPQNIDPKKAMGLYNHYMEHKEEYENNGVSWEKFLREHKNFF